MADHLWEATHRYYGSDGGYEPGVFDTFAALRAHVAALDPDLNLIIRWDWIDQARPEHSRYLGGDATPTETLHVYVLMPRKGGCYELACPITKAQEPEVRAWLAGDRCAGYLRALWAPILDQPEEAPRA